MNATLQALAEFYRRSTAARTGAVKDYTVDWEKFLRETNRHDGDARELAEQELAEAERASSGRLIIDRHPKTGAKEVIRLKREGGESWLFASTGSASPTDQRTRLAAFFQEAMTTTVPEKYSAGWNAWCETLIQCALDGRPVSPFKREDIEGNAALLGALVGILNWRGESLIRYASAVICRDSKALQTLRPRLLAALRAITGNEEILLEDFGIAETPRSVLVHGPLSLDLRKGRIDFGMLSGPVAISAVDLHAARSVDCAAPLCLTVENESVFLELVKRVPDLLLIQTSFPGAATRLLFERLPAGLPCYHFGDSDPAGFDILRDLREKTGRDFKPVMMRFRSHPEAPKLTDAEKRDIARLLASPAMADVHDPLREMSRAGTKGDFEQESLPIDEVDKAISSIAKRL
jgi:hypothetical protein